MSPAISLSTLPPHLILAVSSWLRSGRDLSAVMRCSKRLLSLLEKDLYAQYGVLSGARNSWPGIPAWAVYNDQPSTLQKWFAYHPYGAGGRQTLLLSAAVDAAINHHKNDMLEMLLRRAEQGSINFDEILQRLSTLHVSVVGILLKHGPSLAKIAVKYLYPCFETGDSETALLLLNDPSFPLEALDGTQSSGFLLRACGRADEIVLQAVIERGVGVRLSPCPIDNYPPRFAEPPGTYQDAVYRAAFNAPTTACLHFLLSNQYLQPARSGICPLLLRQFAYALPHRNSGRRELDALELLLRYGMSPNAPCGWNQTLLVYAAHQGHYKLAKLLLDRGALIDFDPHGSGTPLACAVQQGHYELAKLLLDHGALVDFDPYGSGTPLVYAAEQGHYELAKLLLDRGALVDYDPHGIGTPLVYATEQGHHELAQLLRDHRALIDFDPCGSGTPLMQDLHTGPPAKRIGAGKVLKRSAARRVLSRGHRSGRQLRGRWKERVNRGLQAKLVRDKKA